MTRIVGVCGALPDHAYPQTAITAVLGDVVLGDDTTLRPVLERLHASTTVQTRHLALPIEEYHDVLESFTTSNNRFIEIATDLGERVVRGALDRAGLSASDVDYIFSTSVTGIAAPSVEALLVPRLGLRPDVRRLPSFGLGCAGGAAGIARVHDYLLGHPDDVAVVLAVELCSLTLQRDDASLTNLVASGLFGDGAGAVVMVGERRAAALGLTGPETPAHRAARIRDTRTCYYPDNERLMGWDIGGSGFRIVLAPNVGEVVEKLVSPDVSTFLAAHDIAVPDVARWVVHPGGPRILEALEAALLLPQSALARSWQALANHGNLSSAAVIHLLEAHLDSPPASSAGSPAVLMAMGPGFSVELVLLEF